MRKSALAIALLFLAASYAQAVQRDSIPDKPVVIIAGMSKAEIERTIKEAMPLPVVRILSRRAMGMNEFIVDMATTTMVAPSAQGIHVRFSVESTGERYDLIRAVSFARDYAKDLMKKIENSTKETSSR